jgi:hypothetical protein
VIPHPGNAAKGEIGLENTSSAPLVVAVWADDFESSSTEKGLNADTKFAAGDGAETSVLRDVNLPPGTFVPLRVAVANVWEAGESRAPVHVSGWVVGCLTALKYQVPFNVKADAGELLLRPGRPASLVLRNDDPMTYRIQPELSVGGSQATMPPVVLAAGSSTSVPVTAAADWFDDAWSFKDVVTDGLLTLRLAPEVGTASAGWPSKVSNVKTHLSSVSATMGSVSSTAVVLVLLAAGGVCSLLLTYGIPNGLRRLDLKDELERIAQQTRTLSPAIDSSLRVMVRVTRNRIMRAMYSRFAFSPELPALLDACKQSVATLRQQVETLVKIDTVHTALDTNRDVLAPTQVDDIVGSLTAATFQVSDPHPTAAQLDAARTLVDGLLVRAQTPQPADAVQLTQLTNRSSAIKADFSGGTPIGGSAKCATFKQGFPGLFRTLGETPTAARYAFLDDAVTKLGIIRDYIELYDGTEPARQPKVAVAEPALIAALRGSGCTAIRRSRLVLRQMRDGVYGDDVAKIIANHTTASPTLSVTAVPAQGIVNAPLEFRARLLEDAINGAAARAQIGCNWDFGRGGLYQEQGWSVAHYFPEKTTKKSKEKNGPVLKGFTVTATFTDASGKTIADAAGKPIAVSTSVPVFAESKHGKNVRTRTEIGRLTVVLGIALIGLLTGARKQLLELDLVQASFAVFLIGFTADTIKNVLGTQK